MVEDITYIWHLQNAVTVDAHQNITAKLYYATHTHFTCLSFPCSQVKSWLRNTATDGAIDVDIGSSTSWITTNKLLFKECLPGSGAQPNAIPAHMNVVFWSSSVTLVAYF